MIAATFLAFIESDSDKDLFLSMYENFRDDMLRFAFSILKDKCADQSEDAVQEAYLSVAKNIETVQKVAPAKRKAFLVTIVKHKAIDVLRRQKLVSADSYEDLSEGLSDDTPAPIDAVISADGYQRLKDCICRLGDTYKETLEMKLVYNLTNREIARLLGIEEKTVEIRVYRGKIKLKELLTARGEE